MSADNDQLNKLLVEFGDVEVNPGVPKKGVASSRISLSSSTHSSHSSHSSNSHSLTQSQSTAAAFSGSQVVNALVGSLGLSGRSTGGGRQSGNTVKIDASQVPLGSFGGVGGSPISNSPDAVGIEQEILRIIEKKEGGNSNININRTTATGGLSDQHAFSAHMRHHPASGASATHSYNSLDDLDFTVIKFGSNISIRGCKSMYLEAVSSGSTLSDGSQLKPPGAYHLGVKGQGIGEASNCLVIHNIDNLNDKRPIRYGSLVCIRSPHAKDRFLGMKGAERSKNNLGDKSVGKLGFYRDYSLLTQSEKWAIMKAPTANDSGVDYGVGTYVRIGDPIILVSSNLFPSTGKDLYRGATGHSVVEQMLILSEGGTESDYASLVHKTASTTYFGAEFWNLELFNSLSNPSWSNRPYLSGTFLLSDPEFQADNMNEVVGVSRSAPFETLNSYPYNIQESILMRDVLLALAGFEGNYIRIQDNNIQSDIGGGGFTRGGSYQPVLVNSKRSSLGNVSLFIDLDSADRSLANQVMQLLPLCEEALQLKYYLKRHARYEFGLVCHTIVANMKDLVKEFDILVAQLEHLCNSDKLTLQKMYFLLQPARVSLQILHKLARDTYDATGGQALDLIYENYLNQGDAKARKLVGFILEKASGPFLNMLSLWIYRGELKDPYHEFMVEEDTSISKEALAEDFNAQYWETRHTLRKSHVPRFLKNLAERVLTAGKYLNVVRDAIGQSDDGDSSHAPSGDAHENAANEALNSSIMIPQIKSLSFDLEVGLAPLCDSIDQAYADGSRALLVLLDKKYNILSHLNSLRRFFLLEHGDFFIQFMDLAETELKKDATDISLSRLQSVLNVAIQSSTLSTDMHKDDLSCQLATNNLLQQLLSIQSVGEGMDSGVAAHHRINRVTQGLKGVEALVLNYRVTWPVSIVLSKRLITKYQLLSRLLYDSKHVERQLLSCWQGHQQTKQINVRGFLGEAYCLRQRMLHFLQNFVYYMTVEVISPRSHEMLAGMQHSPDIDEVLSLHEKFLDSCLKECLLNSSDLLKVLLQLFSTCLQFSGSINEYLSTILGDQSSALKVSPQSGLPSSEIPDIRTSNYPGPSVFIISGKTDSHAEISKAILKQNRARKALNDRKASAIFEKTRHESFRKTLAQFNGVFDSQIKDLLEKLHIDSHRHQSQLANLCVRIDYNGYYSGKFD